jgi:dihydrolipoamide dehydrogenase
VRLQSGATLEAEKVLVGIGRRLLSENIGLETAGIERGPGGAIPVDDDLRTNCPDIFAVGDVTGRMLLAHLATFQGVQAARSVLGRAAGQVPYHAVPWSIFTTPEIATVGMNETEAAKRGVACVSASVPWMDNVKARIDRSTDGFVKIVADPGDGRIIGGTIVGGHASDMIHILSTHVHTGATVTDMTGMVFAHPGLAETVYDVAQKLRHQMSRSGGLGASG